MHEFDLVGEQPLVAGPPRAPRDRNKGQFTVLIADRETGAGVPDPAYPVGIFEVAGEGDSAIAVADLEGRLLVAIPQSGWHRPTSQRTLPHRSVAKATSIEVPFEDRVDTDRDPGSHKPWIGFLSPELH